MKGHDTLALARRLAAIRSAGGSSEWRQFWHDRNARQVAAEFAVLLIAQEARASLAEARRAACLAAAEALEAMGIGGETLTLMEALRRAARQDQGDET